MSWFDSLPKVELHVHLEGAIPHAALWELIHKYGGDPSVPDIDALKRRFKYRDFAHFIRMCSWKNQFLREYDDFIFIAEVTARTWRPRISGTRRCSSRRRSSFVTGLRLSG